MGTPMQDYDDVTDPNAPGGSHATAIPIDVVTPNEAVRRKMAGDTSPVMVDTQAGTPAGGGLGRDAWVPGAGRVRSPRSVDAALTGAPDPDANPAPNPKSVRTLSDVDAGITGAASGRT